VGRESILLGETVGDAVGNSLGGSLGDELGGGLVSPEPAAVRAGLATGDFVGVSVGK
jgi:hypothetical protein